MCTSTYAGYTRQHGPLKNEDPIQPIKGARVECYAFREVNARRPQ